RYTSGEMKDVVCPPYDIISPEQQNALYERHPHNAVRLELARGSGVERYESAASTFREWLETGVLEPDDQRCLYVYRQDFRSPDGHSNHVAGIIGALLLEPFGAASGVLPHERTMEGPKKDRLALLRACPVNVSPIYAIYRGAGGLAPFFGSLEDRPPDARVSDDDGILHRLWVIAAPAEIEMLRAAVAPGPLVIADGHHRYETALSYREEKGPEPGPHDFIMCFCVDADSEGLVVLPYNRALRSPAPPAEIASRIEERFPSDASRDHRFTFVLPDRDVEASASDEDVVAAVGERALAWRDLDVVALHEAVLPALLPEGIDELTFSKDPTHIRSLVSDGWTAGVLLRAVSAPAIVDVARSGERMPQKASYFWPKAATGLVFRSVS
ncbi:MAG: DUF1015 family protein, partial [Actinomycetota bacterium]